MYSTCIFCTKPLGRNEALEAFPVGQRIAFDAKRGRLWVVCRACERWNLSPFDERWEGVEQAERAYRETRLRVATENIGLARLRDGTTLVRIGEPMRPEFAAWRYGDQFGRRRTRALLATGGGIAALGAVVAGGAAAGIGVGGFGWLIANLGQTVVRGNPDAVVAKIPSPDHGVMHVRRRHLGESYLRLGAGDEVVLRLRFKKGEATFHGREAERIAAIVVPKVNRFGGSRTTVARAVQEIESLGTPERYVQHLATVSPAGRGQWTPTTGVGWRKRRAKDYAKHGLYSLEAPQRLALEMALHEESERRALEGELAELERAWREAEEVAGIADSLTVPTSVEEEFQRLRQPG